jgi:hypothetical protein
MADGRREAIEEFQLDASEVDQAPPPLYPEITLPSPSPLSEEEQYLVDKSRELVARLHASPYYLVSSAPKPDVARHSDKLRAIEASSSSSANISLYDCVHKTGDDLSKYIPLELLRTENNKVAVGSREGKFLRGAGGDDSLTRKRKSLDIDGLIANEEKKPAGEGKTGEEEEDPDGEDREEEPAEDEDDYAVDHYASDGDGNDSGGGEAYFD